MSSVQQQARDFTCQVTRHFAYLLYLPGDYDAAQSWPLVLSLHGSGERGDDLDLVKLHGIPRLIHQGYEIPWTSQRNLPTHRGIPWLLHQGHEFPCIVVAPQCPAKLRWEPDVLIQLIDHVAHDYALDAERIYVTGLSMGGEGTWNLAVNYPDRFAAIVPICGHSYPEQARKIKHLPTWVFHGAKDQVVPLKASEDMVKALEANSGMVQFTVYPETGHDAWTETYANPELYRWLFAQRRQPISE
ncbi:MAG TPA: PHB depolymerase family esterase [Ktedonobacteraceae bacterium]|nr:PHB depolymerase family esterase [Ktedonobacteraceae bacterium]